MCCGRQHTVNLRAKPVASCIAWSALNSAIAGRRRNDCGSVSRSPVTATTTPVSATAEQENHQDDNQDQFHGTSPVDGDGWSRNLKSSTAASTHCSRSLPRHSRRTQATAGNATARVGCPRYLKHGIVRKLNFDRKETHSAQAKAEAGSTALLRATRQNIAFLNAMLRATLTARSNDKCPHQCGLKLFLTQ